jgi:hypothetical protein
VFKTNAVTDAMFTILFWRERLLTSSLVNPKIPIPSHEAGTSVIVEDRSLVIIVGDSIFGLHSTALSGIVEHNFPINFHHSEHNQLSTRARVVCT